MLHPGLKACARLSLAACATVVFAAAAQADDLRYVNTTGNDANPCTLAQPCRTMQHAISQTPGGGELRILASGYYGAGATIDRQMTVSGDGHTTVFRTAIAVNKTGAAVSLRGLVLDGKGLTANGITIAAAAAVHIERCVVHRFTHFGIFLNQANAELFFIDSIARDNGSVGLYADGTGTTAKVTVDNARFENNDSSGLYVAGAIDAAVSRTVATGNTGSGIVAAGARMTVTRTVAAHNGSVGYDVFNGGQMTLESSAAHGNDYGLFVETGTARISNSVFINNTNTGIFNNAGTVLTRQNNTVSGNGTQTSGTLTPLGGI